MSIESLLSRPVRMLPPDASCHEGAQVLRDEGVGCIVVAEDDGRPLGIVTDRDLVVRAMAAGRDPEKTELRAVMSGEPVFLAHERGIDQVIQTMQLQRVRRVPIVDAEGRLEGVVALDDLLPLLADQLSEMASAVRSELQTP
ncbi:MAG TPA: CBS domain-containing protein [Myxococcota bacterium]|nr:CBS domain-containing protein [Myxococcota bacterium]